MILGRPYYGHDYEMVAGWFRGHGWEPVPQAFIPVLGIVVHDGEGRDLAAGWIKLESSTPIAMLEWVVTNPENHPKESAASIDALIQHAKECAKEQGRTAIFTYCKQDSLARKYGKHGFQQSDSGMIHLVCSL